MTFDDDVRLRRVHSREGQAARDELVNAAREKGYHLSCAGSAVPHIQFRQLANERPYSFSLLLNPVTPTFYLRRPVAAERNDILQSFDGSHENSSGEIKIPVADAGTARRIARRFL